MQLLAGQERLQQQQSQGVEDVDTGRMSDTDADAETDDCNIFRSHALATVIFVISVCQIRRIKYHTRRVYTLKPIDMAMDGLFYFFININKYVIRSTYVRSSLTTKK